MITESRTYLLTGAEPILGSNPADPKVRETYIESKKPAVQTENESELTPEAVSENYGLTVFLRHPETNTPMLFDYTVRGFLKEALLTLSPQLGLVAAKSKVDKYLFVSPRHIPLCGVSGGRILTPDGVYERPLRAMTMQGPRVTLTGSEIINQWQITATFTLLDNSGNKGKGAALDWNAVENALDYGRYQGLGQFRNGGFGRFTWKRIDE
jgi:hypothetical protein